MGRLRSLLIPGVDKKLLVRDAVKVMPDLARRRFIAGGASLGALTLLTGCDVSDSFSAEDMLKKVSKFNDAVQAAIFNPNALAPEFPESAITKPFPFNAVLRFRRRAHHRRQGVEVRGARAWSTTRSPGPWRSSTSCRRSSRSRAISASRAGARSGAGPARRCAISSTGRRRHPRQILLVPVCGFRRLQLAAGHGDGAASADPDDVQIRRRNPAAGLRLSDEDPGATKLGFENPKYVISMEVTNDYKGGYWEDQGYNSFSGS